MSARQTRPDEPEHLQSEGGSPPGPHRRRRVLVATTVVAVAAVVGLGGWAAASLMSTGSKPAEAVPANAVGFWSIDLDPSAAQKVEAVRLLGKFPALREELELADRDDLRRWAFARATQGGSCPDLDYDTDVAPWIGERVAVAAVPSGPDAGSPVPVLAVQVTDAAAAVPAIERLAACGGVPGVGVEVVGDYALVSDSEQHADAVARSVENGNLAEDPDFRKWMKRVGDPGIMSVYVAPGAMAYLSDVQEQMADRLAERGTLDHGWAAGPGVPAPDMAAVRRHTERLSGDFEGMAAVVRVADGALEIEAAGESTPRQLVATDDRSGVTDLPAGTAVALGVSLSDGWATAALELMRELAGPDGAGSAWLRDAEALTGLRLPEDLQRLLGEGFAVAIDADLDPSAAAEDPPPVGLRVSGDPADVTDVVDRLRSRFGPMTDVLALEQGDGVAALGLDAEYVSELAGTGTLGSQDAFRDVVPRTELPGLTLYVDLDAVERWATDGALPGGPADPSTLANLEPLAALGLSSWVEADGSERSLLRLTTD